VAQLSRWARLTHPATHPPTRAVQVSDAISSQPDLQFPIQSPQAQTWLLTTYLDDDTRVLRGDGGSVFILVKEVSFSMVAAPPAAAPAAPAAP
jgi:hypothetical protein